MGSRADHAPRAARRTSRDLTGLLWLIALAIAAVFLVAFLVNLSRDVGELTWDPDYASAFTLPETLVGSGSGGHTIIADAGQWVPLWFGLATARLPLHRELWEVAPTVLFLLSALIVGWSVAQLEGPRAALLAVLLIVVASARALWFFMAADAHNTVYPCTALLGAYLIWLTRSEGRSRRASIAVPVVVGLVLGICVASDLLVGVAAVIPLLFTAALTARRRDPRYRLLVRSVFASAAVAAPVAVLTTTTMEALGYGALHPPGAIPTLGDLPARALLLFKGLKDLFNGYLGGAHAHGSLHAPLGIACTVVMSLALLALLQLGLRTARSFATRSPRVDHPDTAPELARSLHVIYWTGTAVSSSGAFWLLAAGAGMTHESYYATVVLAVGAVIPLLLSSSRPARWLIPLGSAILFTGSLVGLLENYMNGWAAPAISPVVRIADAQHLRAGYSGYAQASNLTWNTGGHLAVRPVMSCSNSRGAGLCPFMLARVPAWYVPQRRDTFLLINTTERWLNRLPPGLGRPLASYSFAQYRMYVYPYDIASRFGPLQ